MSEENQIQIYNENQLQTTCENQPVLSRLNGGFNITTQNKSFYISDAAASEALNAIANVANNLISKGSEAIAKHFEKQQEKHFNTLKIIIACQETTHQETEMILNCIRQLIDAINNVDITNLDRQSQKNLKILTTSYEKNLKSLLKAYRYHLKSKYKAMK